MTRAYKERERLESNERNMVYTHGSEMKKTKLEMVKKARMVKNPFLAAMQKKYEAKMREIANDVN